MANGELLRKLFRSYRRRDDQAFAHVAHLIVAEERAKQHHLLADDLAQILDGPPSADRRTVPAVARRHFEELPRDRERDSLLLEIRAPTRTLRDVVLSHENQCIIERVLREASRADIIRTHGLRPVQRLLFCGPPGCGKTLSAEVIAHELEIPLLYTRLDAVISSYLGETASNLRKIFDYASRGQWVLFFDEFDAIGKSRDDVNEHGELKRVVNSYLQIMDGFTGGSLIITATNHEALLDMALWRRFDEIVHFGPPSKDQILPLIELKLAAIRHQGVDLRRFVPKLVGMTHADIERICHDAMKASLLAGESTLSMHAMKEAIARHERRLGIVAHGHSAIPSDESGYDQ